MLVTGKRYYAHEHDKGANEPLGVYWYEPVQKPGGLQWRRHVIDYSTRAGGGGKSGLYFFENMTKGRKVPLTDVISAPE